MENKTELENKTLNLIRAMIFNPLFKERDEGSENGQFIKVKINEIMNPIVRQNVYGISNEELRDLLFAIQNAKHYADPDRFPDFDFGKWFFELFRVSATKEKRKKGALFECKYAERRRAIQDYNEGRRIEPHVIDLESKNIQHEYLTASVNRLLKHHYGSMLKFGSSYTDGCFVIEYSENGLFLKDDPPIPYKMLSDKEMLLRISSITEGTDKNLYVMFKNGESIELFSCRGIPRRIEEIEHEKEENSYAGKGIIDIYIQEKIGPISFSTTPCNDDE